MLYQPSFEALHQGIPAHFLQVEVEDIKDAADERLNHLWTYFQGESPKLRTINLLGTETEDEAVNDSVAKEESEEGDTGMNTKREGLDSIKDREEIKETIRFQYDGTLLMTVTIPNDDSLSCTNYTRIDPQTTSLHVVDYMSTVAMRIDLQFELIKGKVYCDQVDEDKHRIQIESNLGMDTNGGFAEFYNGLEGGDTKDFLSKCSTIAPPGGTAAGPCIEDITHNERGGGAGLSPVLAAGRPNIALPYTKNVLIKVIGADNDVHHRLDFFVEGLYSKGIGNSFAMPTHKPIMILRDPPGKPPPLFLINFSHSFN